MDNNDLMYSQHRLSVISEDLKRLESLMRAHECMKINDSYYYSIQILGLAHEKGKLIDLDMAEINVSSEHYEAYKKVESAFLDALKENTERRISGIIKSITEQINEVIKITI